MRLPARSALVRLARIDEQIRAGRRPNATTLAKPLEVNPRTIQRDLDCLRDQLGAPIDYDQHRRGYVYTDPTYRLPMPQVSEGECLALFLAERLFQQYRHAALAADLERLFQKIAALLPDGVSLHLEDLARAYSLHVSATDPGDIDRFRLLLRAVRDGRQLELNYWSASRDETRQRIVDPYHVTLIDGDCYLIGHCHLREEVRMFAPARIRELRETGTRFDRPDDFRADDYLDAGFRKMRGAGPPRTIRLRFTPVASRFVREKKWHPTQQLEDQADGGAILSFRVNQLAEVKRWVMSFGVECEVIEPTELQNDILNEITPHAESADLFKEHTMQMIDLHFPVFGERLPADHGYDLYAALSRLVPELHVADCPVRIGPVRGTYVGQGMLQLDPRFSRLRLCLPADAIPLALPLGGKPLTVAGHKLRLGVPQVRALVPATNLIARLVVLKASSPRRDPTDQHSRDPAATKRYLAPAEFLEAVRRELQRRTTHAQADLPLHETGPHAGQPRRHVLRVHGKTIVGFTVLLQGLTAEESLRVLEEGIGGRGKMGCGFFGAMKEGKQ